MTSPDSAASRERILAAAQEEFGRYGFAGARTERIARAANVNKQLLFYYFGSKAGLYQAVVKGAGEVLGRAAARVRGAQQSTERLRQQLRHAFDTLAANRKDLRLLLDSAANSDEVDNAARDSVVALQERIRGIVSEGQGLGFFRDDVDPSRTAQHAVVLVLGYFALEPLFDDQSRPRSDWIDSVAALLVGSLTW